MVFFVVCFFKDDNFHELNEAMLFPWGATSVSQHKINVKSILQVNMQVIQAVKILTMQLFTQHNTDVHFFFVHYCTKFLYITYKNFVHYFG